LDKIATVCGWSGAACMSCAPFIIDTPAGKALAIVGLGLLTVQAICNQTINLVCLNLISILGFSYALYI